LLDAHPPLVLEPALDDSKQLMCVEDQVLGISTFAQTRAALLSELSEQLAMLWLEFAHADDSELDVPARLMKKALLVRFSEVGEHILSQMAKQCKLTNKDFGRLIDCPLDRDAYEQKLNEQGLVEPAQDSPPARPCFKA
jgi:hypothetical protein